MAQRFDRAIATAQRLIERNGQLVVWRGLTNGAPSDADKPWLPSDSVPVNHDVFICFVPVKDRATRQFFAELSGREVVVGSLAGLMGNVTFEPTLKDVVIRDGTELAIDTIDLLSPNGQKVLWTIEFKG